SVFSGDYKKDNGIINTFRPISSKPPVYDLTPIGPANIILLSPELELLFTKNLSVTFRYLNVSRYSSSDGLYPSDMRKMTREPDASGMHVLKGVAFDLQYVPNKHVILLLYGGLFQPGNYIRNTGRGKNLEALSLRANYKF
ncbi:MAG TPA: alginate export family protein, partial [Bacteroidales bacterium]|nr:alginate export family protein [Bacteroidales bacterium]